MGCKQGLRHTHRVSRFHLLHLYNPALSPLPLPSRNSSNNGARSPLLCPPTPVLALHPIPQVLTSWVVMPACSATLTLLFRAANRYRTVTAWAAGQSSACRPSLIARSQICLGDQVEQHTWSSAPLQQMDASYGHLKLFRATAREPRNESASFTCMGAGVFNQFNSRRSRTSERLLWGRREKRKIRTFPCHRTVLCRHRNSRQRDSALLITSDKCLFKIAPRVPKKSCVPHCPSCPTVINSDKCLLGKARAWDVRDSQNAAAGQERGQTRRPGCRQRR